MFQHYTNKSKWFVFAFIAIVLILTAIIIVLYLQLNSEKLHNAELNQEMLRLTDVLTEIPVIIDDEKSYAIDYQLNQQLESAQSNIERNYAYQEATQKWQELIKVYLTAFSTHYDASGETVKYDAGVITALYSSQEHWESYCESALEREKELLEAIYLNGSAAANALARYEYSLYRSRALELIELAQNHGVVAVDPKNSLYITE